MLARQQGGVGESATQGEIKQCLSQRLGRQVTETEWNACVADARAAFERLRRFGGWGSLRETDKHNEILRVYQNSRPPAKTLYDQGQYSNGQNEENWVIRWTIRHAFRNNESRATGDRSNPRGGGSGSSRGRGAAPNSTAASSSQTAGQYYDPVRDSGR